MLMVSTVSLAQVRSYGIIRIYHGKPSPTFMESPRRIEKPTMHGATMPIMPLTLTEAESDMFPQRPHTPEKSDM